MSTVTNNRCSNPSFESGTGLFFANGGTVDLITDDPLATGTNCIAVGGSSGGQGGAFFIPDSAIGSSVLSFDAWLGSGDSDWFCQLLNLAGDVTLVSVFTITATGTVQRVVKPFTTSADPGQLAIYFSRAAESASEIRVDAFRIGEDGTFFDGDTPDTATDVYEWTGTPGESASTRTFTPAAGGAQHANRFQSGQRRQSRIVYLGAAR